MKTLRWYWPLFLAAVLTACSATAADRTWMHIQGPQEGDMTLGSVGFMVSGHLSDLDADAVNEVYSKRWRELDPEHALLECPEAMDVTRAVAFIKNVLGDSKLWITGAYPADTLPDVDKTAAMLEQLVVKGGISNVMTYCVNVPCENTEGFAQKDVDAFSKALAAKLTEKQLKIALLDASHPNNGMAFIRTAPEIKDGMKLAHETIEAIRAGADSITFVTLDGVHDRKTGKYGLIHAGCPDFMVRPPYYMAGLISRYLRCPAKVLQSDCTLTNEIPMAAVENRDGSTTLLTVNTLKEKKHIGMRYYKHKAPFRQYTYSVAEPPNDPFADLPVYGNWGMGYSKQGGVGFNLFANSAGVFITQEHAGERPERVRHIDKEDLDDGRKKLSWEPVLTHDKCYYRIYKLNMPRFKFAKKKQIGSTIRTTFIDRKPDPKMKYYAVIPVNMHSDTSE